jgi:hypothetical protein
MALGYAPTQQPVLPASTPAEGRESRPQRIVLTLVRVVRNLRDERDVQCLTFLAGELGILPNSPFCFSRALGQETAVPESLILRDTMHALLERRWLDWEDGQLRNSMAPAGAAAEGPAMAEGISWLGALLPSERLVLTRVLVQLQAAGSSLLQAAAEEKFHLLTARLVGTGAAAEASRQRLSMVRRQLALAH